MRRFRAGDLDIGGRSRERRPIAVPHAIIGREAELQRLRDVVQRRERPLVAFVEGEAGVGKTALLEAVVEEAAEAGSLVLRARPTAAEAGSSYAALDDLLRPAIGGLPRLAEPQRRALAAALLLEAAVDPVDPRLVGLACLSLLDALAGPVLLAVDDWQWLDAASAAVLSFVLRRLDPGGAKVIATVRRGEADEALAGLVRALPVDQALELTGGSARRGGDRAARPRADRGVDATARTRAAAPGVWREPAPRAGDRARAGRRGDDGHPEAARPPSRGALGRRPRGPPVRRGAGGAHAGGRRRRDATRRAGPGPGSRRRWRPT